MRKSLAIFGAIALSVIAGSASASVVSGEVTGGAAYRNEGGFVLLNPKPGYKVQKNGLNTWNLYAFNEKQSVILDKDLVTDGGIIKAGTRVSSHYVMFDPAKAGRQKGDVSFDSMILGVISSVKSLLASDFLGKDGVSYYTGKGRGTEKGDHLTLDPNAPNTLALNWKANSPGDFIRVITAAIDTTTPVPVPAAGLLMLGALGGLSAVRRRKA